VCSSDLGLSVGKLFLAGAIPGTLLGLGLMFASYTISKKKNHPKHPRVSLKNVFFKFIDTFWALMMAVIILVGIVGGFFTPTEASIVAVLYALIVGIFVYKGLHIRNIPKVIYESAITTASLMVLVGFANLFGWIMASEQIPQILASSLLDTTTNKILILLIINLVLLMVGTFMETIAALLILFPVLLNVAVSIGVEPIHFAVVVVLNLVIGLTTPPVGVCLFVASGIGKTSIAKISKAGLPFLLVCMLILLLITFIPQITLFLPELLMD